MVSKAATTRMVQLDMSFNIVPDTIPAFLGRLRPLLEAQLDLARKAALLDAVREVTMDGADPQQARGGARGDAGARAAGAAPRGPPPPPVWLSDDLRAIANNAASIKQQHESQPRSLEYLSGIVTDLFVDVHKFRGQQVTHKMPELIGLLRNYDFDALVAFFASPH